MILWCFGGNGPDDYESLIHKAAQFSRAVSFSVDENDWWTEERMLQLISLPCMQHLTELNLSESSQWVDRPLVQSALLGLPRLRFLGTKVGLHTKLLPRAFATASNLTTVHVDAEVRDELVSAGSMRALRLAPSLTGLCFRLLPDGSPPPSELVWCLPPTLTELWLCDFHITRDTSRPLLKALFSRTPLLTTLHLSSVSIEATLRGFLDAGIAALPVLRFVEFGDPSPEDCSVDIPPDPLEPIFRRFVHRFPQTKVRIEFLDAEWEEPGHRLAVQMRYVGWPSVELFWKDTQERIGGPPIPRPADDADGSDVEELQDPLAGEER